MAFLPHRLRILLLAYHCNPKNPSEPTVAFEWARHLQDMVDLTVVTHERNRRGVASDGRLRCSIVYVPTERFSRPIWWLNTWLFGRTHVRNKMFLATADYYGYNVATRRILPGYAIRERFDLVHRVSPKCLSWPSSCVPPDFPYLLGPVNSGMSWPPSLRTKYQCISEAVVNQARLCGLGLSLGRAGPKRRLLVANRVCLEALPRRIRRYSEVMPDSAITGDAWPARSSYRSAGPLQLLYVGRLVALKGVDLLVQAVAACRDVDPRLRIAGDGPLKSELETQIARLHLEERVEMLGHVEGEELPRLYQEADVFVFPSLREAGGNVVYEALATGVPVIAIKYGGPAELVTEECGILIDPSGRDAIVVGLVNAIRRLATDRDLCRRLGQAAATHIRSRHLWPARVQRSTQLYTEMCSAR